MNPSPQQPTVATLYPTMHSLAEVHAYANSCLPVKTANDMFAILKLQQNTIVNLLKAKK